MRNYEMASESPSSKTTHSGGGHLTSEQVSRHPVLRFVSAVHVYNGRMYAVEDKQYKYTVHLLTPMDRATLIHVKSTLLQYNYQATSVGR